MKAHWEVNIRGETTELVAVVEPIRPAGFALWRLWTGRESPKGAGGASAAVALGLCALWSAHRTDLGAVF